MIDLDALTITGARDALAAKDYSARELAEAYLEQIAARDGDVHAYLEVFDDVVEQADAADAKLAAGDAGSLTGIPLAVKDNILIEGKVASAASKMLEHYTAAYSATVIEKLSATGAVYLGRANMDEFAMGGSTENSAFGPTKNPLDTNRVPGGSSGGSAAAVAMQGALAALGSDTGGSIRQPASYCGVVGLKPTYGSVSRSGLIAMGSSLDQIGPLTKNVADAKLLFEIIRGKDPKDSTSREIAYTKDTPEKLTIGVPRAFFERGVSAEMSALFENRLADLAAAGHTVVDIELPSFSKALAAYYIIMPAEASTNLARFDGIRYGLAEAGSDVRDAYERTRAKGFGPEVRRRILIGTYVLSAGYHDEFYGSATRVRNAVINDLERAFDSVDVITTPTAPSTAFPLGAKADPLSLYLEDIFTVPANLAGVPALSVPMGNLADSGSELPVGMQFIGAHDREDVLFFAGSELENSLK